MIENFIDERNKALYTELSKNLSIVLKDDPTDPCWGIIQSGEREYTIWYNLKADHLPACFTHELLHAKIQQLGYRRPVSCLTAESIEPRIMLDMMNNFDNELQHWKMHRLFTALKFDASTFYNDLDVHEFKKYIRDISQMMRGATITPVLFMDIALRYISAIIPVGPYRKTERKEMENMLTDPLTIDWRIKLSRIKDLMNAWATSAVFDSETIFKALFQEIGMNKVWFSYEKFDGGLTSDDFPGKGFFTKTPFSPEEVNKRFS